MRQPSTGNIDTNQWTWITGGLLLLLVPSQAEVASSSGFMPGQERAGMSTSSHGTMSVTIMIGTIGI